MNFANIARLFCGCLVLSMAACSQLQSGTLAAETAIQGPSNLRYSGDSVSINTVFDGRHRFVSGHIGDSEAYSFIVDTGAGVNVLDLAIANRMGLEKVGETEVLSGGVEPMQVDIVIVPSVQIDDLTIVNAEFVTMDLAGMSNGMFHGVIGMELFREALLAFDPSRELITISDEELSNDTAGVVAYDGEAGEGFGVPINVAGKEILMHLDTGSPSSFSFPLALSDSLPLQGELTDGPTARLVGGERRIKLGKLDGSIQFAGQTYADPDVLFINPSSPYGNIGSAILNDLVMRIDQRNHLIEFRRSDVVITTKTSGADKAEPARRIGLQLRGVPGGGALTVTNVISGSLAEAAGFQAGDILVSVNGQASKEFDMRALGALFKSAQPLTLEIDRDGRTLVLDIS